MFSGILGQYYTAGGPDLCSNFSLPSHLSISPWDTLWILEWFKLKSFNSATEVSDTPNPPAPLLCPSRSATQGDPHRAAWCRAVPGQGVLLSVCL